MEVRKWLENSGLLFLGLFSTAKKLNEIIMASDKFDHKFIANVFDVMFRLLDGALFAQLRRF